MAWIFYPSPKSGTELNARVILKATGLSYEDLGKVEFLPYAESVELIKNRQLDATLQSSGLGMAAFRDLAAMLPVRFIPVPPEVVAAIGSAAYQPGVIPANTYDGQTEDVPTATITNILVSHNEVPDDLAYQMTRLMFENLDRLSASHAAARGISLVRATAGLPIPLHPGAERFYREIGELE